jgi:hypothetical protein
VYSRAFEHQGLLAFASLGSLYVLDGSNGALRQAGHLRSGVEEPSFSHDGRWLAYIAAGKEARVYGGVEEAPYAPAPGPLVISASDGTAAHVVAEVGRVDEAAWPLCSGSCPLGGGKAEASSLGQAATGPSRAGRGR